MTSTAGPLQPAGPSPPLASGRAGRALPARARFTGTTVTLRAQGLQAQGLQAQGLQAGRSGWE
jgi:hypothetical protein